MKYKILALTTGLVLATFCAQALAQNLTTPPSPTTTAGALPPCGNKGYSDPPSCGPCGDKNLFGLPVASDCDGSPINSANGNGHRQTTDLRIEGSVGNSPLNFTRISNTRLSSRNLANGSFGVESPWSHNYEWLLRDDGGTVTNPIITVTYPDGKERQFKLQTGTTGTWKGKDTYRNADQILSTGDDFVLHTGELEQIRFKRRTHSISGGLFYRVESITDSEGNTQTISYNNNDDTSIRQITDAAGHWIKLHYRDEAVLAADPTTLNASQLTITNDPIPQWREMTATPGDSFRILAFYQGNGIAHTPPPKIVELEFYDENNTLITGGTPIGSSPWVGANQPSHAFDGNDSTYYLYPYTRAGYCGIDLGAGNERQVSRIRYKMIGEWANYKMSFVGINNGLVDTQVLSHVEGSDGRQIDYNYTVYSDPSGLFQWVQLAGATYPDTTASTYTYKKLHDYCMPVIDTASDPRFSGNVKQVRYDYDLDGVIGFVTDQYDNASGQLLVSIRWDGNRFPKLVYPNGKVNLFIHSGDVPRTAVDSFGAVTKYTYGGGFVTKKEDTFGRITTYTRRADFKLMGMTMPGGSVTTYTRDTAGYLTAVNENGKVTTYTLDPTTKRRTRADYADGTYETWTYNSYGQRLTHRLRNGSTQSWTYNAASLLTQHVDTAGTLTTYTYNSLNRLASETRHLDGSTAYTTSYEYNDRGQITKMTHPDGSLVENIYDDYGYRMATMDERGQTRFYTYDSLGRMLTMTDSNNNVTTYDYTSILGGGCGCNTRALPITITYPDGTVTLNSYDKEWRLLSTTVAYGTPQAATTSYSYDYAGQRTSMTDPLGRITTYSYNADGRLISETQASNTALALTSTSTYSVDGNLLSTTRAAGTPVAITTTMSYDIMDRMISTTAAAGTPVATTTSSTYNNLGQLASTTDPLGRITNYVYDAAGRQTDTILPDGTTMRSVYDAFGRTVQSIAAVGLAEQAITSVNYDSRDRVVTQTDPTGVTTTMTYDAGGLTLSVTSPTGKSVEFDYDANGNQTHRTIATGTAEETTTIMAYDSRNRVVSTTDGEGSITTMTYDPLGRTLSVTDQLGHATTYTYDLIGRQLTTKDADNLIVSTITYDALDRVTSQKDGKNQTISYQYDALGRETAYTDAKGATFSFQYDALGRLTRRTEPDATFQTYTHDAADRLLVHTKADGQTKTHHYENPHRDFLTKITYSNGEAPRVMSFDRLGRLLTAANAHAAITRTYDAAGRQLSETQLLTGGLTGTFHYQYDGDGNLSRHIRPDGSIVDYAWNARNLLAAVTSDGPPPVATYTYNGRNQISSTIVENGIFTASRTYDAAGRLNGVTNGALDTTGYTLSPDGRRTGVTRNGQAENYDYDNARQVTSASYGGLSTNQSWNYDAAGNRSSATTNGLTTNYLANSVNEYTSISGLPTNPNYDDNGNAITWNIRPPSSGIFASASFYWDINNQLAAAVDNNTSDSAAYQYDALGRRTKRTETLGGVTTETWFFSNGWNVELERNASNLTKRMTWGLDLSQSLQGAGGVGGLVMVEDLTSAIPAAYFPTYDGNGNITAWVNSSGTVVARQRYDAFGNIIAQTGTAPSNYGFSTKPMDQVTRLLYYGYRYYDPETGRWPSRDPIGERGGVNLYGFVNNDGVNQWDLLGLWTKVKRNSNNDWAETCAENGDTWFTLADKLSLEESEASAWVKNYDASPEVGKIYFVPNVSVFYSIPLKNYVWIQGRIKESLNMLMKADRSSGYKVVNHTGRNDTPLFRKDWLQDGLAIMSFGGHGYGTEKGGKFGWRGFRSDENTGTGSTPGSVNPPYKIQEIRAYTCGGLNAGWDRHLSKNGGRIMGYNDPTDDGTNILDANREFQIWTYESMKQIDTSNPYIRYGRRK